MDEKINIATNETTIFEDGQTTIGLINFFLIKSLKILNSFKI